MIKRHNISSSQGNALSKQLIAFFTFASLFYSTAFAVGEEHDDHVHDLGVDENLVLKDVFEKAVAIYPTLFEIKALETDADAWNEKGSSFLGGVPAFTVRYQSDKIYNNEGLEEIEAGVELPLWRWGQRSAARNVAESTWGQASYSEQLMRWQAAGELRVSLWKILLAENAIHHAETIISYSVQFVDAISRRHELGDLPEADVILAKADLLEKQIELTEIGAILADANRDYRALTGLEHRPALFEELQIESHDVKQNHPYLLDALADVSSLSASKKYIQQESKENPILFIGTRSETVSRNLSSDDSIGISLRIPFGGSSFNRTKVSAANRELADAEVELARRHRNLDLMLHEAEHSLTTTITALAIAEQRDELYQRRLAMATSAFEKGETDLLDMLLIQNNAQDASLESSRRRIELQRDIAFHNQAIGVLP
jgi:cobalt-zinc-cadmium efflux system outer membrane protein